MDKTVQLSVIAQLQRRPEVVDVGPFVIGWEPNLDSRFVNYATPRLDCVITPDDVAALVAAFREIGRVPRLEYVISTAPDLEQQLSAAGFTVEVRHDYLVCSPDSLVVPTVPAGFELAEPTTDDERAGMIAAQGEAFEGQVTVYGALTAAITQRLFAAGAEVAWLEASGEDSWRVYERVGYAATGKRLYIALDA